MNSLPARILGTAVFAAIVFVAFMTRATAPPGRYTISNGTVYDTKTKLTWQQTISGSTYSDANATSYCAAIGLNGATWRLPTVKELATIIDFSVAAPGPAIDTTSFVGTTPTDFNFETSTAFGSNERWSISFMDGTIIDNDSSTHYVRCVH